MPNIDTKLATLELEATFRGVTSDEKAEILRTNGLVLFPDFPEDYAVSVRGISVQPEYGRDWDAGKLTFTVQAGVKVVKK